METELKEAMASGVFVEFQDAQGNSVGQAVYLDWRGRPLPAVGDTICSSVQRPGGTRTTKVSGRVRSRQFDVQIDTAGGTSVWVRLVADVVDRASPARPPQPLAFRVSFSAN